MVRALGLCSGGLDSILSAMVLISQKIDVCWISFETPFFSSDKARIAATKNNIPLIVINITKRYMEMMLSPGCKFGKNMNPCMDCHSLMFRIAGDVMIKRGFDFMFSGEVLGQRPMSQNKSSLRYVEKHSGFSGYILRPLSAKKLPITIPEIKKKVNRDQLLGISGRSRKFQIELASKFGVDEYPTPGGGCLLTDKSFSNRLSDLLNYQNTYLVNQLNLLRFGRHLRLNDKTKIVIGRNLRDNENIICHANLEQDVILRTSIDPGPVAVMHGEDDVEVVRFAASICAGYSKAKNGAKVKICVSRGNNHEYMEVIGRMPHENKHFLV